MLFGLCKCVHLVAWTAPSATFCVSKKTFFRFKIWLKKKNERQHLLGVGGKKRTKLGEKKRTKT